MYSTCLFCTASLGENESIEHFPVGRRLAFDVDKGRLWVICTRCRQWNLSPIDERWEAIEDCERCFRGTLVRVSTGNIGLARLPSGIELVRIGAPLRPEFAAWRYGPRLGLRRRRAQIVTGAGVAAAVVAGVALAPAVASAFTVGFAIVFGPSIVSAIGAVPVVATLAAREYMQSDRVVARLPQPTGALTVRARHLAAIEMTVGKRGESASIDVPHDDGWTRLEGTEAMHATGVILAGANPFGGTKRHVQEAVAEIESAGDASGFLATAAARNGWRGGRLISLLGFYRGLGALHLSPTECLALEMAVHEESERRLMDGELEVLTAAWRHAEEIARICDDELSPP
jgi:hypothetical protein